MRIMGGSAKGRRLSRPPRRATRPTKGLVKGALYGMLEALGADLTRCLDLYAGSGSLGIEALSRGAGHVDFVEESRRACLTIERNLEATGFRGQAQVHCRPAEKAIGRLAGPFTTVIIDPPFAAPQIEKVIEQVATSRLSDAETMIAVHHFKRVVLADRYAGFVRVRDRRHGDSVIAIYQQEAALSRTADEAAAMLGGPQELS